MLQNEPERPPAAPPSSADLRALYDEARALVAATQQNLARLQALLDQLGAQLPAAPLPSAPPAASAPAASAPLRLSRSPDTEPAAWLTPNGILATTGAPLLSIDAAAASDLARTTPAPADELRLHYARVAYDQEPLLGAVFGNENAIEQVGWAVVVHADEDAELLKAISPLILKRCADQGLPAPPLDFRAGETCGQWLQRHAADTDAPMRSQIPVLLYYTGEGAALWLARHGVMMGPVDPQYGVPFYLLLLGRPGAPRADDYATLPFDFQYELDLFWGVGRLCFTDPLSGQHDLPAYRAYAEHAVAFEQASAEPAHRQLVYFGPQHPGERATALSSAELLQPLFAGAEGHPSIADQFGYAQQLFIADQATHANLGRILSGAIDRDRPSILFTASHGLGFSPDDPRLAAHQGALICQDWPGQGPLQRGQWFAADDLPDDLRVDGMIAICFACYGAGCPQFDQFVFRAGQERVPIAPYPLVAQLPQRLLARGALAVLGHVDRAWSYSFSGLGAAAQAQRFASVLGRLLRGDRAGAATDQFNLVQGALAARLADALQKASAGYQLDDRELAGMWAARNDARNYLLLGDPAVRLAGSSVSV